MMSLERGFRTLVLLLVLSCDDQPTPTKREILKRESLKREILMKAKPVDPLAAQRTEPVVPITNVHEHVMHTPLVAPLLTAMDNVGIERTVVLGSPIYTFLLGKNGFTEHDRNNMDVLEMAGEHPDRIIPFVVVYPEDADAVEKLTGYIALGAKGIKIFAGHGAKHGKGPFHTMPLDDSRLEAIYTLAEAHNLPVLFHVNYAKYKIEFERVLKNHPRMKVLCPHFCLTLRNTNRVRDLLRRYPNLWMDVSFGWIKFQAEGYRRIDKKPEIVRKLILDFPDRFTFGTDLVITAYEGKSAEWITMNSGFYRDLLERKTYEFYGLTGGSLTGLNLPVEALTRIYRDNAAEWLSGPPREQTPPPMPTPTADAD